MKQISIFIAFVFILIQTVLIFASDTNSKGNSGFIPLSLDGTPLKKKCANSKKELEAFQADPLSFMKECSEYQELGVFKVVNVFSLQTEPFYQCIYTSVDISFKFKEYRIKNIERLIGKQITVFTRIGERGTAVIVFGNLVFRANYIGGI